MTAGIGYYEVVKDVEEHFEERKTTVISNLQKLVKLLFRADNMMVSYTAAKEGLEEVETLIAAIKKNLFTEEVNGERCILYCDKRNEGFKTSSKIQYVARAGNFIDAGYSYHGALQILKVILGYDYLWTNVRVKGGAYGCMTSFSRLGDGYFTSYRDPNLEKTNQVYEGVTAFVKDFDVNERDMTKYIIGTISNIDQPMTPSTKGERSMNLYMNKVSPEMIYQERNEILSATAEDIRNLADIVEAVLNDKCLCVVGNEEKIEEQKSMFGELRSIF